MNDMLQTVDDEARREAKALIRTARFASLAALEPTDGAPTVSRVSVCNDFDGRPGFLMSRLSGHFPALEADARCALLFGEPGKGDPLAYPRITVGGRAEMISDEDDRARFRARFVEKNPKSRLYVDFGDMAFWRLTPERVNFNGGFARAFAPSVADLLSPAAPALAAAERRVVDHMNDDHADAVDRYAAADGAAETGWRLACLDAEGMEIVLGDAVRRIWFEAPVATPADIRAALVALARA